MNLTASVSPGATPEGPDAQPQAQTQPQAEQTQPEALLLGPDDPYATTASSLQRGKRLAWWVFLAPALLALTLIANGAWQASHRGDATTVAEKALAKAYEKKPFTFRLPATAPDGAVIIRVFLDEPDSRRGYQAYQLNVWYRTPGTLDEGGGRTVHVWQTNDKFLSRRLQDPTQIVGEAETVAGQEWHRVVDDRVVNQVVTTFSRRFDDGITVAVDSKDPDLARATIAALQTSPVPLD